MLKVTGARKRGRSLLCRAPGAPSPRIPLLWAAPRGFPVLSPCFFGWGFSLLLVCCLLRNSPNLFVVEPPGAKPSQLREGLTGVWLQASFGVRRGHLNPLIRGIWANAAPKSSPRSGRGALPGREQRAMASSCRKSRVRAGRGRAAGGRLAGDGARGVDGRDPRGGGGCCPPAEPRSPLPEPLSVPPCAPPRL